MTIHRYLLEECGIQTRPVVGYVNDGTDDVFISHGWLEHEGRKTDLTLSHTDRQISAPGALIIQDRILKSGSLNFTYHEEMTLEALAKSSAMMRDPQTAPLLAHKQAEHQAMSARASNASLMMSYLAMAPNELSYETMTSVLTER